MTGFMVLCLSHPLNENTPGYGGKKDFSLKRVKSISNHDSCNQHSMQLSGHIGTHVDAPLHFCNAGPSITDLPLETWISQKICLISDPGITPGQLIEIEQYAAAIPEDSEVILFRSHFESRRIDRDYWECNPGWTANSGLWLRRERPAVRFLGFDFISLTSYQHRDAGKAAHREFLSSTSHGNPILLIEDMSLQGLSAAPDELIIAPMWIEGIDGAPATVFAKVRTKKENLK